MQILIDDSQITATFLNTSFSELGIYYQNLAAIFGPVSFGQKKRLQYWSLYNCRLLVDDADHGYIVIERVIRCRRVHKELLINALLAYNSLA